MGNLPDASIYRPSHITGRNASLLRKPASCAVAVIFLILRLLKTLTQLKRSLENVLAVGLLHVTFSIVANSRASCSRRVVTDSGLLRTNLQRFFVSAGQKSARIQIHCGCTEAAAISCDSAMFIERSRDEVETQTGLGAQVTYSSGSHFSRRDASRQPGKHTAQRARVGRGRLSQRVSGLDFECLILTQTMSVRFLVLSIRRDSPRPIRPNFAASDSENPKNASKNPETKQHRCRAWRSYF